MGLTDSFSVTKERQDRILQLMGDRVSDFGEHQGDFWIRVDGRDLLSCVDMLAQDPACAFDHFVDLCGVDYLGRQTPRFESVVHLYSMANKHRVRIRVTVPDETLTVPSLTGRWAAANWQERESFDMYGIRYEGHPNLDRILSPPETEIFAQRKDYALKGDREKKEVEV